MRSGFGRDVACGCTVSDLDNAHSYNESFCGAGQSEHFSGTTAISASSDLLDQLETGQLVDFSYDAGGISSLLKMWTPFAQMEEQLEKKEPVEIYGIYFDFDSSVIKPESEPVLKEISDVMHKKQDWKLSVSGDTDNIGNDAFNAWNCNGSK